VLCYRPPAFGHDYPRPDWRVVLEFVGEHNERDVVDGARQGADVRVSGRVDLRGDTFVLTMPDDDTIIWLRAPPRAATSFATDRSRGACSRAGAGSRSRTTLPENS
jgi:hypothetical protein